MPSPRCLQSTRSARSNSLVVPGLFPIVVAPSTLGSVSRHRSRSKSLGDGPSSGAHRAIGFASDALAECFNGEPFLSHVGCTSGATDLANERPDEDDIGHELRSECIIDTLTSVDESFIQQRGAHRRKNKDQIVES